jgi:DNA-binding HxlR family transcriptional regulator
MRKQRHETYVCCPVEAALDFIGGKWKVAVIFQLMEGTKRFNQLQRLIPNITRRMLTLQLRELEADGLISRKVYQEVPPKVEYSLTELGLTLQPIIISLKTWGEVHAPHYREATIVSDIQN